MPRLSIIIPAFGALEQIAHCKHTVEATTDPGLTEVLIQDDGCPTFNGPYVFGACCERNRLNLGFAGNCNAGARRAHPGADVLLFLNQDISISTTQTGWDARLLSVFDAHPEVAIVGPTLLFPNGRVQSVGGAWDSAGQPYHVALGMSNPDWAPIATGRYVDWVTGAALAVRRGVWNGRGGFDVEYGRGYFEDADLCVAVQYFDDLKVWHEPSIRFTHEVGSAGGNRAGFQKNARLFKRRWVDTKIVVPEVMTGLKARFWA